ncbi:hypothetical protein SK571_42885 [Lentzea sp. BCCO 10_0798]|uniref:DoxX-like family protein n=1 Tax=Lentzea kristufekii TaxID=3095430 RepID=A0ABU4U6S6_9PSEU|nr:hypothetical protein [Lentzea sp. BCCO 10_0798]MDX8056162.1 hypothetical protein [Lentzea sp. BCCO 10_0798]
MTPGRWAWVRPVLAVAVRAAVGVAFAALGAWEWAHWHSAAGDAVTAALQWASGCLRLTLGVWLALGVLARFAGVVLCAQAVVTALVGSGGASAWTVVLLGASAVLVHSFGARWSVGHLCGPRW